MPDGYHGWAGVHVHKQSLLDKCPVECLVSLDQSKLRDADAVVLEPPNHHHHYGERWREVPLEFPYPPEERPAGQLYAMFHFEQEAQFPLVGDSKTRAQFDLLVSWEETSDVQIGLGCGWGAEPEKQMEEFVKPVPRKLDPSKLVSYFASRCCCGGAEARDEYARELRAEIERLTQRFVAPPEYVGELPVHVQKDDDTVDLVLARNVTLDSYGICLNNMAKPGMAPGAWPRQWSEKMATVSQYYFILAFENNNMTGWVTEKPFNALQGGTVPIYMGADNMRQGGYLPHPDAAIFTDDFASAKQLAHYIVRVALLEPHLYYERHHRWRALPAVERDPRFQTRLDQCVFFAECRLCQAVYAKKQERLAEAQTNSPASRPLWQELGFPRASYKDLVGRGVSHDALPLVLEQLELASRVAARRDADADTGVDSDAFAEADAVQYAPCSGGDAWIAEWLLPGQAAVVAFGGTLLCGVVVLFRRRSRNAGGTSGGSGSVPATPSRV